MADKERLARLLADADTKFDKLASADSKVRRLSEATRENSAKTYSGADTIASFQKGLKRGVERFGQVSDKFNKAPKEGK